MNDIDLGAFSALFQEACVRCFGHAVTAPLTETDAKLFSTKVFDVTGLVIGWKSIKNYSGFLLGGGKTENPSVATLDTLARYVAGASYTTELERKATAGHYPYWYGYREQWVAGKSLGLAGTTSQAKWNRILRREAVIVGGLFMTILIVVVGLSVGRDSKFRDDFHALSTDSLRARGWWVVAPDTFYWNKRVSDSGVLTLYTLEGDNWPDPQHAPVIRNLLQRRIPSGNWLLEWHFDHFIPHQNWQQAGVLLSEGNSLNDPSLRISIAYNDYNGVYPRRGTILLQAIISRDGTKPEEIAHVPLFSEDSLKQYPALASNLDHTALRIVQRWGRLRILYADGILPNTSFREIGSYDMPMEFRFVGLFALRGFVDSAENMPVRFSLFRLERVPK